MLNINIKIDESISDLVKDSFYEICAMPQIPDPTYEGPVEDAPLVDKYSKEEWPKAFLISQIDLITKKYRNKISKLNPESIKDNIT